MNSDPTHNMWKSIEVYELHVRNCNIFRESQIGRCRLVTGIIKLFGNAIVTMVMGRCASLISFHNYLLHFIHCVDVEEEYELDISSLVKKVKKGIFAWNNHDYDPNTFNFKMQFILQLQIYSPSWVCLFQTNKLLDNSGVCGSQFSITLLNVTPVDLLLNTTISLALRYLCTLYIGMTSLSHTVKLSYLAKLLLHLF